MGVFRQFGQLLWKNIVLRKRQPHVLLLEIVWPVFIFVIVALVRVGLPPTQRQTCSYNPHAMPSGGMVPFLQSTVCNLENTCESVGQIQEKQQNAGKLSALISSVQPYLTDRKTLDALDSLDTGVKLVKALDQIAENGTLEKALTSINGSDLMVKNLFKDSAEVKRLLVNDLSLLSSDVADALLDSTVNVVELLTHIGYIDFKGIACDPSRLEKYMLFQRSVNVTLVSKEVCAINNTKIPAITEVLQKQIDMAAIVRASKSLMALTNQYNMTDALDDIAALLDMVFGTSSLSPLLGSLPNLAGLPDLLKKFPSWVDTTTRFGEIDTNEIQSLITFVDPIVELISPDDKTWNDTKHIVQAVINVIESVGSGDDMDWNALLTHGMSLADSLQSNGSMILPNIGSFRLPENFATSMMSNNSGSLLDGIQLENLQQFRNMMEQFLGKNTSNVIMVLIDDGMDVLIKTLNMSEVMQSSMMDAMKADSQVSKAVSILMESGPGLMKSFMKNLIQPQNLVSLMESSGHYMEICDRTVYTTYGEVNKTYADELQTLLCNTNMSKNVHDMIEKMKGYNVQSEYKILIDNLDKMMSGHTLSREVQTSTVYTEMQSVMASMERMDKIKEEGISTFASMAYKLNQTDGHYKEWTEMFSEIPMMTVDVSWPMMLVTVGPLLENTTTLWNQMAPWIRTTEAISLYTTNQMKTMNAITQDNKMEKLMTLVVDYSPELANAIMDMMNDTEKVMEVMSSDITVSLCQNQLLRQMNLPDYVPVMEMEEMICTGNLSNYMMEVGAAYDTTTLTNQIAVYFDTSNGVGTAKGFNWTGMVYSMNDMLVTMEKTYMSQTTQGPWNFMQKMNFTKVVETIGVITKRLSEMLSDDSSMMDTTFTFLAIMDTQMKNSTEWRVMKHYLKIWDAYVRFESDLLTLQANPDLTLEQFLSNISKTFADFVHKSTNTAPYFLDALKNVTSDPSMIMKQLMTLDLSKLCNGTKVTTLLASPQLAEYESYFCQLNWTAVAMDIFSDNPNYQEYLKQLTILQVDWANLPDIDLQWDQIAANTKHYFNSYTKALSGSTSMFGSNFFDTNILNKANVTLYEIMASLSNAAITDPNWMMSIYGDLNNLRNSMMNQTGHIVIWGNTTLSDIMKMEIAFNYQQFVLMKFIVKQMQYFNSTHHVNLKEYLNSPEMNKILDVIITGPEMNVVLLETMMNVLFQPDKMVMVITSWDKLCSDVVAFKLLLPAETTIDASTVQARVCGLVINETKLMIELSQSVDGFSDVIQMLLTPFDKLPIESFSPEESQKYSTLFESLISNLIMNPPNITLGNGQDLMSALDFGNQWEKIMQAFNSSLLTGDLDQIASAVNGFQSMMPFLINAMENASRAENTSMMSLSILKALVDMDRTTTYQLHSVLQFAIKQLKYFNDTDFVDLKVYLNSSEVHKLIDSMTSSPELNIVVLQTFMEIAFQPDKLQMVFSDWNKFCTDKEVLKSILPADSTVDATAVLTRMCGVTINETVLFAELYQNWHGFAELINALSNTNTDSMKADYSDLVQDNDLITKLITDLMMHPPNISMGGSSLWTSPMTYAVEWEKFLQYFSSNMTGLSTTQMATLANGMGSLTDLINMLIPADNSTNSTAMNMWHEISQIEATVMNQIHSILQFAIKQLEYFNSTDHVNLKTYLNSSEVHRIIDVIAITPELNKVLLQTFLDIMVRPDKFMMLMNSMSTLCTDKEVLKSLLPVNTTVDVAMVQSRICGLSINETLLMTELSQSVKGLADLLQSLLGQPDPLNKISQGDITKDVELLIKLLTDLMTHPPNISLGISDAWIMTNSYNMDWENFLQQLMSSLSTSNVAQSLGMLQQPGMEAMFAGFSNTTEFKTVLQVLNIYLTTMKDQMMRSQGSLSNIYDGYPEMQKVMVIMDDIPLFYQAIVYNSVFHPTKVSTMVTFLNQGWESFCNYTGLVLADVPGANYSANLFKEELCGLNLTKLMIESSSFQGQDKLMELLFPDNSTNIHDVSIADISKQIMELSQIFTNLYNHSANMNQTLPRFLMEQYWVDTTYHLNNVLSDPTTLMQIVTTNFQNFGGEIIPLLSADPFFKTQLQMLDISFSILEKVLDNLNNDTVISFDNFFGKSEEMKKVWSLIQKPGTIELLINSINNKEFGKLLSMDTVDAVTALCHPVTANFSAYFSVPAYTTVDMKQLKDDFCSINFTSLSQEVMTMFDFTEILAKLNSTDAPALNWTAIVLQYTTLTNKVQNWIENPPIIKGIPAAWMNNTYWLYLFMNYASSTQSQHNITSEINNLLIQLTPFLNQEPFLSIGAVLESLLNITNREFVSNFVNQTLEDLESQIPSLKNFFSSMNISSGLLDSLLKTPIKSTMELMKLFQSSHPVEVLCSPSSDFWENTFDFENSSLLSDLSHAVCNSTNGENLSNLFKSLNLKDIMAALKENSSLPDWRRIIDQTLELTKKLDQMMNASSNFDWGKSLQNLISSYTNDSVDITALLLLYSELDKILVLFPEMNVIDRFLRAGQVIFESIENILKSLKVSDGNLNLGMLLHNSSSLQNLLQTLNINDSQIQDMLSGFVKSDKYDKFLNMLMNPDKMAMFLCDEGQWKDMFSFPTTLNLTRIVDAVCHVNSTELQNELISALSLQNVLNLMKSNGNKTDIEGFIRTMQRISQMFLDLTNTSSIDFGNIDWAMLSSINMTQISSWLEMEMKNLQEKFPGMATGFEDWLVSVVNGTTGAQESTAIFHGISMWSEMLLSRLTDVANKPLNFTTLIKGTHLEEVLQPLLADPQLMEELANLQVNPQKLLEAIQSSMESGDLCQNIMQSLLTNASSSVMTQLKLSLCGLNETSLLKTSIAMFLTSYVTEQQFHLFINEALGGWSMMNLTSGTENRTQLAELLKNLMNMNIRFSNLDNLFNVTAFTTLFERLGVALQQQFGTQISNWSPMLIQIFGAVPDPMTAKSIQTLNVILQVINERLRYTTGTISLESLLKNSTTLTKIFHAAFNLNTNGMALLKQEIQIDKLMILIQTPNILIPLCQNDTVAEYISSPGGNSAVADDIATILCINPDIFLQALQNQTNSDYITAKLTEIWSSNSSHIVDWPMVDKNINEFWQLFTKLIEHPPDIDWSLMSTLDLNQTLASLNQVLADPTMFLSMMSSLSPALNHEVSDDLISFMVMWQKAYTSFNDIFKELNGSMESNFLDSLSMMMMNMEYYINPLVRPYYSIMIEKAGQTPEIQSFVCNMTALNEIFNSDTANNISLVLCGKDASLWPALIQQNNMNMLHLDGVFRYIYFVTTGKSLQVVHGLTWSVFLSQMQSMTELVSQVDFSQIKWEDLVMDSFAGSSMNQTIANSLRWLESMGQETKGLAIGFLGFMTELNKFLDMQLGLLQGHGTVIPLTALLPNNTLITRLLDQMLGQETAATLLLQYIAPEKFWELSFSDSWLEVTCNYTIFMKTFTFPEGFDVEKLQHDLCNQTKTQNSAMTDIIMKLDIGNMMGVFNSWVTNWNSTDLNSVSNELIMAEMQKMTSNFIQRIMYVGNLNFSMDGIQKWMTPITEFLYKMQNSNPESLVSSCDGLITYMKDSDMYEKEIKPVLHSVVQNMMMTMHQMEMQKVFGDILCDLSVMNLTAVTKKLMDANVIQYIQLVMSADNMTYAEDVQCKTLASMATDLMEAWNETTLQSERQNQEIARCLMENQNVSIHLWTDTASTFNLIADMIQIIQDPSLKLISGNPELMPFLEFFLSSFTVQKNVSLKISELFKNSTSSMDYLETTVHLAPEIINAIFKSTLNVDAAKFLNFTVEEIQNVLCNYTYLDELINTPTFAMNNFSFMDLSAALCGPDVKDTAQTMKDLVNFAAVSYSLSKTLEPYDPDWWSRIASHVTDVVEHIQQLESFGQMFTSFDLENIEKSVIPILQRFIFDSGPEVIAQSIVLLLEEFKVVDNSTFSQTLISDLQTMVRGLTSLKIVRNFIPANVLINDVLKDPVRFHQYLMTNLSLSKDVADAILTGTVKYSAMIDYSTENIIRYVCNATELSQLLNVSSSKVTIANVSSELCRMNESNALAFAEALLLNVNIGKMLEDFVNSGLDTILDSVDIPKEEVKAAVKKLTSANVELQDVTKVFENKSKEFEIEVLLQPQALTSGESMSSVQQLLCGKNAKKAQIDDTTGASSLPQNSDPNLDEKQQAEMQELPGEFCQNLYKDIVKMDTGAVIWTYLKPLVRGKIPYAPDTPVTRRIIEKMNATTFAVLADVIEVAKSWSAGSEGIYELKSNDKAMKNVETLFDNSLVDGFLKSSYDVSTKELFDGLNILSSVDTNQISNMTYLANLILNYSRCVEVNRFQGYATEEEVAIAAADLHQTNNFLAGIVFDNIDTGKRKKRSGSTDVPKHITYKIRMDIENVKHTYRIKERFWRPYPEDNMFMKMRYFRGFVQLQDMLEQAIINIQTGLDTNSTVYLQQFPSQCHTNDIYLNVLSAYLLPIMMTIAWLAAIAVAAKNLVYDRENGQEEVLKTMGLNSIINWWAWFLITMLFMVISSLVCCFILRFGNLYQYTNFGILILYFIAFCFSSTMMCYMISSFFTRTTLAILTVLVFYLISYLPYIVLISLETQMVLWQKILACLSSTTAFGFAAQYLSRYEIQMVGIHWSNIDVSPIPDDTMNFSLTCIIMVLDGVLYLIIGWYVRHVKPGKYGISKPWYFPVSPAFWGCGKTSSPFDKYKQTADAALMEEVDKGWNAGISLRGLTKKFGKFKVVKNLNCDFYEGEITVLLGHNGAAKSTTLNMMTGILEPTSGSVQIYGKSARKNSRRIGVCPQNNALFEYMTVMEHMQFYASIKSNLPKDQLKHDIMSLLKDVDLLHAHNTRVSDLSGGMKRRLSIALAFTGGSEAIILDEPTSGVDPSGRRAIWHLLSQRKMRCTILLSTHFLDEADMIGDRVAIMHNGRIMCAGSTFFLKNRLGSGYHMKLVKGENFNGSKLMAIIKSWLPDAAVVDDIGSEVTVSLPLSTGGTNDFQRCLVDLDHNVQDLGIGSYGVYDTTMDEVFHKVCAIAESNKPMTEEVISEAQKNFKFGQEELGVFKKETEEYLGEGNTRDWDPRLRVGICTQKMNQIQSLLIKRFHHYRRDWRTLFSVLILPLLMFTAASGFMYIRPESASAPARLLSPPLYGPDSYAFVKDLVKSQYSQSLVKHLMSPPGIGPTCMKGMNYGSPFQCVKSDLNFKPPSASPSGDAQCKCTDYQHVCNDAARLQTVPTMVTNTTTILQDLDSKNIETYLLQTAETFKLQRYGGLSFNSSADDADMIKSIVWFNNKGFHALPSFYNALSNTLLRTMVANHGLGDPAEYGITAYNHPLLINKQQLNDQTFLQNAADLGISFILLVAFTFVPVGFVVYIVNEHKTKEKQLQFISGVGTFMYWLTSLIWDLFLYSITLGLTVAIMAGFKHDIFWFRENLQGMVVLAILYGWALIPAMYSTVRMFRDATSAYMVLFCSSIFIGVTTSCCLFILEYFSTSEEIRSVYEVIKYILLVFPQFSFTNGFLELTKNQIETDILARFGQDVYKSPFSPEMLQWNYIALGIFGFVFCIVTLLMETTWCSRDRIPYDMECETDRDSDEVKNEKQRVLSNFALSDEVVVKNISKMFKQGKKKFMAVNHLCFGVAKGECFGLLGVNGAGKTTTFKMLTGDLKPSEGAAYIRGERTAQGKARIGQELGYCPQVDALDNYLSGRELLHCHARLRGLPSESRKFTVDDLIRKLNIGYADRPINTYSGGMKRMLSLAVAMVGNPPVILLDEPTTGMDPIAKRLVWSALLNAVKSGQSVVLTSHSMEECDAICTRLGIMVNGELRCLGSSQLLKDKYGDGYSITLYTSGLSTDKYGIMQLFQSHFTEVSCRDHHQGILQIHVGKGNKTVSTILQLLEESKERYNIQHFSISQTTLDDVFLNFARDQNDGISSDVSDYFSSTESESGTDSNTHLSEPFTNPTYAYMNAGYLGDKDLKFGPKSSSVFISTEDIQTKL